MYKEQSQLSNKTTKTIFKNGQMIWAEEMKNVNRTAQWCVLVTLEKIIFELSLKITLKKIHWLSHVDLDSKLFTW